MWYYSTLYSFPRRCTFDTTKGFVEKSLKNSDHVDCVSQYYISCWYPVLLNHQIKLYPLKLNMLVASMYCVNNTG